MSESNNNQPRYPWKKQAIMAVCNIDLSRLPQSALTRLDSLDDNKEKTSYHLYRKF